MSYPDSTPLHGGPYRPVPDSLLNREVRRVELLRRIEAGAATLRGYIGQLAPGDFDRFSDCSLAWIGDLARCRADAIEQGSGA